MWRFAAVFGAIVTAFCAAQESAPATRSDEAVRLIPLLDSDDFATRERATAELLRLGESARPDLVDARANGSLERQVRIAQILQALGVRASSRPVRRDPTRVSLDAQGITLSEAAARLSAQSGYAIRSARTSDPVVTLSAEQVPFFEALDLLCARAQCKFGWDARQRALVLEPTTDPAEPVAYAGPLRITIVALTISRTLRFAGTPVGAANLQVRVDAEERSQALGIVMPVKVKELVDDQGRNLRPPEMAFGQAYPGRFDARRQIQAYVPLVAPETDAKSIRRLEFTLGLLLPTELHEVELAAPEEGAEAGHGDFHVLVEEWRTDGPKTSVKLVISRPQVTSAAPPLITLADDSVTFVGRDGNPVVPLTQQPNPGATVVTYVATVPADTVASVRIACLKQFEAIEIPVVFENVPLP